MKSFALSQASTADSPFLDLWTVIGGMLATQPRVTYEILDPNLAEVLGESLATEIGTGHVFAEWQPDTGAAAGLYRIRWRVTDADDVVRVIEEDFEVTTEVARSRLSASSVGYCAIKDMRDEGVTTTQATDAKLANLIMLSSRMIDRLTKQWFEARATTMDLDGNGSPRLPIGVPIIGVESVAIHQDLSADVVPAPSDYRVYARHITGVVGGDDDRQDPKLEFFRPTFPLIGWKPSRPQKIGWPAGNKNITVVGAFGYTDPTPDGVTQGATPEEIRHACKLLVVRQLPKLTDTGERMSEFMKTRITEERTRDQAYKIGGGTTTPQNFATGYLTGDEEIDGILSLFMAPIAIGFT